MKILMILAADNFRDTEYLTPRAFFEKAGFEVQTTSTEPESVGRFGYRVYHENLIHDLNAEDFDAILFVGGGGSLKLESNSDAKRIAQESLDQNKILGALCAAPRNLLKWNLLKGKKCTGHNWDDQFPDLCEKNGALYQKAECVVDENIITAHGPEAVEVWAHKIITQLLTPKA